MSSTLVQAEILNVVVLAAVFEADLGSHRKLGLFRILRPVIVSALVVPFFAEAVATHGNGLLLELLGVAAGLVGGLIALSFMRVYRYPKTGRVVTAAGLGYVLFWLVVVAARMLFSYGSSKWFTASLGRWLARNHIASGSLTDALLFMAIVLMLTRTLGLVVRRRALGNNPAALIEPSV